MSSTPYYRRWCSDYVADTVGFDLEADGLYSRMLDAMWLYDGLPTDTAEQAKLLRVQLRKYKRITGQDYGSYRGESCKQSQNNRKTITLQFQKIFKGFVIVDSRLWHKKLLKEWNNAKKRQEVAAKNAGKRWSSK